jgi:hypothetical protein
MFEVEKPRRFHYEPRFYDPEKEKWEALKKKYAIEKEKEEFLKEAAKADSSSEDGESDLAYFEQRLQSIDREKRQQSSHLTWKDLFRKREMPKFNYQPRFSGSATATPAGSSDSTTDGGNVPDDGTLTEKYRQPIHKIKIRRRFDISDTNYMKPISGGKIILYCFIVFLLLTLVIGC